MPSFSNTGRHANVFLGCQPTPPFSRWVPPLVIHGAAQLLVATIATPLGYWAVSQLRCLWYYFWVPILSLGPFNLPNVHLYEGDAWAMLQVVFRPPLAA